MSAGSDMTILRLVQRVVAALGLVPINTLGETEEDALVLEIVNRMYEELIAEFPWAHEREFVNLEVTATAHVMRIPSKVVSYDTVYYNDKEIHYLDPRQMDLRIADNLPTDRDPTRWSTTDDTLIIFDSYDGSLQSSLSSILAQTVPTVEFSSDSETTGLPQRMNNLLFNMVMEWAAEEINGDTNGAERYAKNARRLRQLAKRWARRHTKQKSTFGPDYARRCTRTSRRTIETSQIIEG